MTALLAGMTKPYSFIVANHAGRAFQPKYKNRFF